LCDIAGVDEFVNIIDKVDLDPIWYCELLKACVIFDKGDATITSLSVMPNKGPQGKFAVDIEYVSQNGTGTGELAIEIKTIDGVPLGTSFLLEAQKPGKYRTNIELDAQQDPDCDPSQGPCEQWLPGLYPVEIGKIYYYLKVLQFFLAQANFYSTSKKLFAMENVALNILTAKSIHKA